MQQIAISLQGESMKDIQEEVVKSNQLHASGNIVKIVNGEYGIDIVSADKIKPKPQPWFWQGIIPFDTSTLFAGYGGIGKSQLLIFLAAHTTNGLPFTAGGVTHQLPNGSVILLSGEDDPEYQLIPKLIAANAELSKVFPLKMMKSPSQPTALLDLDAHLSLLEDVIITLHATSPVKLIIVDPVQYFTGQMKDHINVNVCTFIGRLNDLAKRHHLAIIMNKHLRKGKGGDMQGAATDSVSGSAAWTTSPRSCWLVHPHPTDDNKILFADLKANLRKKNGKSFTYQIDQCSIEHDGQYIQTTKMFWHDELEDFSADQALNTSKVPPVEQAIRDWIIKFLLECNKKPNNGAMFSSADLYKEAQAAGHARNTYYTVKKKMIDEGIIREGNEGRVKRVNMVILNDPEIYS